MSPTGKSYSFRSCVRASGRGEAKLCAGVRGVVPPEAGRRECIKSSAVSCVVRRVVRRASCVVRRASCVVRRASRRVVSPPCLAGSFAIGM